MEHDNQSQSKDGGGDHMADKANGRKYESWQGYYPFFKVNSSDSNTFTQPLKYYCIALKEYDAKSKAITKDWCMVPLTWMSCDNKFAAYPPSDYTVGGKDPLNWGKTVFKKHSHPNDSWEEYDVLEIFRLGKPVDHHIALKAMKAARTGKPNDDILEILQSDSSKTFGKKQRKGKKTQFYDSTLSEPTSSSSTGKRQAVESERGESDSSSSEEETDPKSDLKKISEKECTQSETAQQIQLNNSGSSHPVSIETVAQQRLPSPSNNRKRDHDGNILVGNTTEEIGTNNQKGNEMVENLQSATPSIPVSPDARPGITSTPQSELIEMEEEIAQQHSSSHANTIPTTRNPFCRNKQTELLLRAASSTPPSSVLNTSQWSLSDTSSFDSRSLLSLDRNGGHSGASSSFDGGQGSPTIAFRETSLPALELPATDQPNSSVSPSLHAELWSQSQQHLQTVNRLLMDLPSQLTPVVGVLSHLQQSLLSMNNNIGGIHQRLDHYFNANQLSEVTGPVNNLAREVNVLNQKVAKFTREVPNQILDAADFHQKVVENRFPGLPYDTFNQLSAMNTVLADPKLGVSLVSFLYVKYRCEGNLSTFFNEIYKNIFTNSVSEQLQWRAEGKANDKRPGISSLLNIVSVISATCNIFTAKRDLENLTISKLIQKIKDCRKNRGKEHRGKVPKAAGTAPATAHVPPAADDKEKVSGSLIATITKLTSDLEKAIADFKMPDQ